MNTWARFIVAEAWTQYIAEPLLPRAIDPDRHTTSVRLYVASLMTLGF